MAIKYCCSNRQHDDFKGYIPAGGKLEFPEIVNPVKNDRYMIFNYLTEDFKGSLLENAPEGKPVWVNIKEAYNLPMQPSIRRRFPFFFEEGTFEIQVTWDAINNNEGEIKVRKT